MTFEQLTTLAGTWQGEGEGVFPTIASFAYRETTHFLADPVKQVIRYEQRTWLTTQAPSHWEVGFLCLDPTGTVLFHVVHANGRMETMTGHQNGNELVFSSGQILNDVRMVGASRSWQWNEQSFSYRMAMQTTQTNAPQVHLRATLTRV